MAGNSISASESRPTWRRANPSAETRRHPDTNLCFPKAEAACAPPKRGDEVPSECAPLVEAPRQDPAAAARALRNAVDLFAGNDGVANAAAETLATDIGRAAYLQPTGAGYSRPSVDRQPRPINATAGRTGADLDITGYNAATGTNTAFSGSINSRGISLSAGQIGDVATIGDIYICDGWATAGATVNAPAGSLGIFAGGWSDYAVAGMNFTNQLGSVGGYISVTDNRKATAEPVKSEMAPLLAKAAGLDPQHGVYRLKTSRIDSTGLKLSGSTGVGQVAGGFRLDIAEGHEWHWSTLTDEAHARQVVYEGAGKIRRRHGKTIARGFAPKKEGKSSRTEINLDNPLALNNGDHVDFVQQGWYSLAVAGGSQGIYGGVQAQAYGTLRTTIVKVNANEVLLFREPLDVRSLRLFGSTPTGLQIGISRSLAQNYREAFRFRFDPNDAEARAVVEQHYHETLAGKAPCKLNEIKPVPLCTMPGAQSIAMMRLLAEENAALPPGVDRLFVSSSMGRSRSLDYGLHLYVLPRSLLPETWENSLSRNRSRFRRYETIVHGDGRTALCTREVGQRRDSRVGISGHEYRSRHSKALWVVQRTDNPATPYHVSFQGLTLNDVYDDRNLRGCDANHNFVDPINRRYGLRIPRFGDHGHHDGRNAAIIRTLKADDLYAIADKDPGARPPRLRTPHLLDELPADDEAAIAQLRSTSQAYLPNEWMRTFKRKRAFVRHVARVAGVPFDDLLLYLDDMNQCRKAGDNIVATDKMVKCTQNFVCSYAGAVNALHRLAGGKPHDLILRTGSTAYEKPGTVAEKLALRYGTPLPPGGRQAVKRFRRVIKELRYIERVSRPVLRDDPFLSEEEKRSLNAQLNAAEATLRQLIDVSHLSDAERDQLYNQLKPRFWHRHRRSRQLARAYLKPHVHTVQTMVRLLGEQVQNDEDVWRAIGWSAGLRRGAHKEHAKEALRDIDDACYLLQRNVLLSPREKVRRARTLDMARRHARAVQRLLNEPRRRDSRLAQRHNRAR